MNREPKPRIRKVDGAWVCVGGSPQYHSLVGFGDSPAKAYLEWLWRWLRLPYALRGGTP